MIQVKTLKPHSNSFGDKLEKAVDDEYPVPDGYLAVLEGQELVERVKKDPAPK